MLHLNLYYASYTKNAKIHVKDNAWMLYEMSTVKGAFSLKQTASTITNVVMVTRNMLLRDKF